MWKLAAFSLLSFFAMPLLADDPPSKDSEPENGAENAVKNPDTEARNKQFTEMLSGVKLVGQFTILGKEAAKPRVEEYTITSVRKLGDEGDLWLFNARIKYGSNDYTVPLPLNVKWADDTPMITLTDFKILGQGPFSARVIFYNGKYAGTWSHGKVGGHMFGKIVKLDDDDKAGEDADPPKKDLP